MAIITVNFQSQALGRKVTFSAIIPLQAQGSHEGTGEREPLKTIYLLHGYQGDHNDWMMKTNIEKLADIYHFAVIMPAGENSFYVNQSTGGHYATYVGEELVRVTRELFPLSHKREDTSIVGLSMGGYGALRNGLKNLNTFGQIAAFSSVILTKSERIVKDNPVARIPMLESIVGSNDIKDLGLENDLVQIVHDAQEKGTMPAIFLACGTEDALCDDNQAFHEFLLEENVEHQYIAYPGEHDWDFWKMTIEQIFPWLLNR